MKNAGSLKALILMITLLTMKVVAQEPFFRMNSLPVSLKDCEISAIIQDSSGMIWLGTSCGVIRFDGFDYEIPEPDNDDFHQPVSALFQEKSGKMWVGYKSGKLAVVNKNRMEYFSAFVNNDAPVSGIVSDQSGNLFISTYGNGVYYFAKDSMFIINQSGGLADNFVYTLVASHEGTIWAGTDAGINILKFSDGKTDIRLLGSENGLPDIMIQKMVVDDEGNIWAGAHDNGFCIINPKTFEIKLFEYPVGWNFGPVTGIVPGKKHAWISTQGSGLVKIDLNSGKSPESFTHYRGNKFQKLDGIMRDSEGIIWSFTGNRIVQIPGDCFGFVYSDENNLLNNVHAIMTDRKDNLWYVSDKGLFRHSPDFNDQSKPQKISLPTSLSQRDITCIFEDKNGYIWIGSFGRGLYRLNPDLTTGRFITEENGFINNNILSISSNEHEIWFSTLGGASRFLYSDNPSGSPLLFENFDESKGLGNNFIYCVYADTQGRIWFATDGTGITMLRNGQFINFGADEGLMSNKIYSITEDSYGKIWCATHDNMLYHFMNDKFELLKAGFDAGSAISALAADKNGNLLIVHENGLDILDTQTETLMKYRDESGIYPIIPEFNSTAVSSDGSIWIGAGKGLIKYLPPEKPIAAHPAVFLKSVEVFLEPVDFTEENSFSWDQNHISFSYIGLWFHNPSEVRYRHFLEGYDLDWSFTGDRMINYSNLPGGKYVFRVSASQHDDFSDAPVASYAFEIAHPIWQQWWFWAVMAVIIGSITSLVVKTRLNRIRRIEALKKEKILFQFETLKSQVNPHFLFNSFGTLISIIDENPTLAIEYVEKLSVFFRNILEFRDKDLISLREELEIIANYIFLQKKRFAENLRVEILVKPEDRDSLIPPLTLQLLIENAIKHNVISMAKPLKISVRSETDGLRISNNLQKKPAVSDSTGFGLKTIVRRYQLLGDYQVKIEETEQQFSVTLPFIKTA